MKNQLRTLQIRQTINFHGSSIKQRTPIRKGLKRTKTLSEVKSAGTVTGHSFEKLFGSNGWVDSPF